MTAGKGAGVPTGHNKDVVLMEALFHGNIVFNRGIAGGYPVAFGDVLLFRNTYQR